MHISVLESKKKKKNICLLSKTLVLKISSADQYFPELYSPTCSLYLAKSCALLRVKTSFSRKSTLMTKPHWSMLCESPEAGLGLWNQRLIPYGERLWDKKYKIMTKQLGCKKETGDFKLFVSCDVGKQFIRNAYVKLLPVSNSAPCPLSWAPNHTQNAHGSGSSESGQERSSLKLKPPCFL